MLCCLLAIALALLGAHAASAQQHSRDRRGTEFVFPDSGLAALNAPLGRVRDIAPDRQGGFFISDEGNRMVMRVSADGTLAVYAGNGFAAFSGDGGPVAAMRPCGLRSALPSMRRTTFDMWTPPIIGCGA